MRKDKRSEEEVVFPPFGVPSGGLFANLVELAQVLRVLHLVTKVVLIRCRLTTLLLKAVDVLRSDAERAHVLVDLQGHLHLIVLNTANDKRLVESKVTLDAGLLHHLLRHEGFLNVAILAVAFNHDAVGDEVRLAGNRCIWL